MCRIVKIDSFFTTKISGQKLKRVLIILIFNKVSLFYSFLRCISFLIQNTIILELFIIQSLFWGVKTSVMRKLKKLFLERENYFVFIIRAFWP